MKTSIFLFIIIMLFTTCKKYEDGPIISLHSAKKRLCRNWYFVETTKFDKPIEFFGPFYDLEFKNDNTIHLTLAYGGYGVGTTPNELFGEWSLIDNNKKLVSSQFIFVNDTLTIQRLTNKELWLLDETNTYAFDNVVYKFLSDTLQ